MRDFVIQLHRDEYHDFVRYLKALDFRTIVLHTPPRRFKTWGQILRQYGSGLCELVWRHHELRDARTVVVFSHFAFVVKLVARCGCLRYQRLFCFGFFLHDPRWFRLFRWLVRLDRSHDHYIVFSESEVELYRSQLGIEQERIHFIPLADWRQIRMPGTQATEPAAADYYFAGGRSNRDYVGLVEAFRSIPAQLVIACSQVNWEELKDLELPANVTVLRDIPITEFDEHVRNAKAGILPLRHDTGSSGQSVALALMRDAKCILATKNGGLQEYIDDGVSGYWINDLAHDLPRLIRRLEEEPGRAEGMGKAARQHYEERFSLTIAASAFENVLASVPYGAISSADAMEMES